MIPGGGWHAAFPNVDISGEVFTEPVVAWRPIRDGLTAMVVDWHDRREVRAADRYEEFVGFLVPDDTEARESLEEAALQRARDLREKRGMPPFED